MNLRELKLKSKVKVGDKIKVVKYIEYYYLENDYYVLFEDGDNDLYLINGEQVYPTAPRISIKYFEENE